MRRQGAGTTARDGETIRAVLSLTALALATPLAIWLFATNPRTPAELRGRIALGVSPEGFEAEMYRARELLENADRFFEMEKPSNQDAATVQRAFLEARGRFARAVERAGSPEEAARARRGWAEADLRLARWALTRGKAGGLLEGDDEDLFRWGLAYAREALALDDVDPAVRADLEEIRAELERELTLWR